MMFKEIAIAILIHLIVCSLVWVGFPVLLPTEKVRFYYSELTAPLPSKTFNNSSYFQLHLDENMGEFDWKRSRSVSKPKG